MSPAPIPRERSVSVASNTWRRQGSDAAGSPRPDLVAWVGHHATDDDAAVFDLDEELTPSAPTRYPAVDEKEEVIWAAWDKLVEDDPTKSR